jgi:hypothetical protein
MVFSSRVERQNQKIKNGLPVGFQLPFAVKTNQCFCGKKMSLLALTVDTNYDVKAFHGTDFLDQLVNYF